MNVINDLQRLESVLFRLPPIINYCGFTFTLAHFTDGKGEQVGYLLTGVTARSPKKRNAFKNGFWFDEVHQTAAFFTNFLTIRFYWSETGLLKELLSIESELNKKGIIQTL
jgi:hypothetical protein